MKTSRSLREIKIPFFCLLNWRKLSASERLNFITHLVSSLQACWLSWRSCRHPQKKERQTKERMALCKLCSRTELGDVQSRMEMKIFHNRTFASCSRKACCTTLSFLINFATLSSLSWTFFRWLCGVTKRQLIVQQFNSFLCSRMSTTSSMNGNEQ